MKINLRDFPKKVKPIRDNEVYSVHDLYELENLVVSMTILHPKQATRGHSHEETEEVYIFLQGEGEMQLDDKRFKVEKNDLVLVPKGVFHRVFNQGEIDLIFLCVFEKYENRGKN
ncbi:MAG: cupin [Candidatus Aenigmatarchaeota archaeon]|nr:MAG: cupin [Candidatus Aenigmarchaeota archaeon]